MDNLNPNPKKEIKPVVTAAVTRKKRTPMIKGIVHLLLA